MVKILMENVIEGFELFKTGKVDVALYNNNKVIASCGTGDERYQVSLNNVKSPFERYLCTCDIFIEDNELFCPHLVALIYSIQKKDKSIKKLFTNPYEEEPLTVFAQELLFSSDNSFAFS